MQQRGKRRSWGGRARQRAEEESIARAESDGPNHLGLRHTALLWQQTALTTSDCAPPSCVCSGLDLTGDGLEDTVGYDTTGDGAAASCLLCSLLFSLLPSLLSALLFSMFSSLFSLLTSLFSLLFSRLSEIFSLVSFLFPCLSALIFPLWSLFSSLFFSLCSNLSSRVSLLLPLVASPPSPHFSGGATCLFPGPHNMDCPPQQIALITSVCGQCDTIHSKMNLITSDCPPQRMTLITSDCGKMCCPPQQNGPNHL